MAKKVTMQKIADHLGVSKFVVSKSLSGKGGVNETTRERVIQAASQLGYFTQKNAYVQSIKRPPQPVDSDRNKQSVLVLMPNIRSQTQDSLYWGKIVDGIALALDQEGLGMVIVSEHRTDNFVNILNPSGLLGLIGVGQISTSLLLEVHRIGLPMVLIDHEDPLIPSDTVFANNTDCMTRLSNHLMGTGHTELHFIGNIRYSRSFRDRWIGFRSALEENGMRTPAGDDEMLQLEGMDDGTFDESFKQWMHIRKKTKSLPTALVCANDFIALTISDLLKAEGFAIPGDVSVTGFDNIEDATRGVPPLTTVHVPKEAMGRAAVEKLLNRIHNPAAPLEKILIAADIVHRDSVAGPRV
ncbi:LacI family DNA-binding transcriptional regulator [Paenibacillus sp. FSL R5-0912]|uniref:LacI family DNA-binding transcriptional regulator n=1 Tax=Paenibacillus sp. FSL R5-0912 TaxID=1536771 RepID=UPI0004F62724|nr:LacI family DNA-binding transcriptional regulator [Paenibacillus sp. FSL R5-0912]AIQ40163.1 LacI family transcriptional regulator [Paenibacillus sp. FSL R5-0912]